MSFKVVIYLEPLSPMVSSVQPSAGGPRTHCLELASDGVYMAFVVTNKTVVSYTAFPPLLISRFSSLTQKIVKSAVYLCCTILGVASTSR